jgi:[ribosomal protein S18]-alanine N-acetyltransferase
LTATANPIAMIKVREASPADIPAMIVLARTSETAAHWHDDDYWRIFTSHAPARLALVLEAESRVSGFIVGARIAREWDIENVVISPLARRCGLGTRLLADFMQMVRSAGAEKVLLEVRESNRAARALYEKAAFVQAGRRKQYYSEPAEDALVYRFEFDSGAR